MWRTSIRKSIIIFVLAIAFIGVVASPIYLYADKPNAFDAIWKLTLWSVGFGAVALTLFEVMTRQAGEGVAYRNTYWSHILILQLSKKEACSLCWDAIKALNLEYKLEPSAVGSSDISVQIKRKREVYKERILIDLSETPESNTRIDIFCLPIVLMLFSKVSASSLKMYSEVYKLYVDAISQYIESRVDPAKVLQSSRGERLPL